MRVRRLFLFGAPPASLDYNLPLSEAAHICLQPQLLGETTALQWRDIGMSNPQIMRTNVPENYPRNSTKADEKEAFTSPVDASLGLKH